MNKSLLCILLFAASLAALSCQQPAPNDAPTTEGQDAAERERQTEVQPEAAVEYEPAYPEQVSAEGLSPEDVATQKTTHTHGDGEAHTHGDGEAHSHDGDSGHDDGSSHDSHDH